jgi:hypothetical protein
MSIEKHEKLLTFSYRCDMMRHNRWSKMRKTGICRTIAVTLQEKEEELKTKLEENWKGFHKPSPGPYSRENPRYCVNCGQILTESNSAEECPA